MQLDDPPGMLQFSASGFDFFSSLRAGLNGEPAVTGLRDILLNDSHVDEYFILDNGLLRTRQSLKPGSYSLIVHASDGKGDAIERGLQVDVRSQPAVRLSHATLPESQPAGSWVGDLSLDSGESASYALADGPANQRPLSNCPKTVSRSPFEKKGGRRIFKNPPLIADASK